MTTEWPSKDLGITVRAERLEELRDKEAELPVVAEHLRCAHAEIAALRAALMPFATFARHFNAMPISNTVRADTIYAIHRGHEHEAEVRLSDCRTALAVLEAQGVEVRP